MRVLEALGQWRCQAWGGVRNQEFVQWSEQHSFLIDISNVHSIRSVPHPHHPARQRDTPQCRPPPVYSWQASTLTRTAEVASLRLAHIRWGKHLASARPLKRISCLFQTWITCCSDLSTFTETPLAQTKFWTTNWDRVAQVELIVHLQFEEYGIYQQ